MQSPLFNYNVQFGTGITTSKNLLESHLFTVFLNTLNEHADNTSKLKEF